MSSTRRRRATWAGAAAVVLAAAALLGPRARVDEAAVEPVRLPDDVEGWLREREAAVPGLREDAGKAIVWADPGRRDATELAVVYLHGFSADRHEVSPVPERVAAALGANLFLTRLKGHGQDGAAMGTAAAADWLQDAEEALAVGARLGRRVVLVGTSTGGTLALWAASRERWRDVIAAVVLVSPNLGLADEDARVLLWPWGGLLARLLVGPERCFEPIGAEQARHWTTCYPTRSLLPMMALVEHVRTSDLARVRAPLLVLYDPDDAVVEARETERLFPMFGSERKALIAVTGGGDPQHHVLAGDILSPLTTERVVQEILRFLGEP